jgi:GntR family transcriptional regulator
MARKSRASDAGASGYKEIADHLRAAIASGEFAPGSRVPSENDLMAQFGVEQPTAWRALDLLKNEGLVYAKRGSGTFVREFNPVRRVSPNRLRAEVWGTGRSIWSEDESRQVSVGDVRVTKEEAPSRVAAVLGLGADSQVWVRRRRYLVDDHPVQTATSYYPASLVDGSPITEVDTGVGGAYARLADLGHVPVRFREELRARMPTSEEADLLELHRGTPVVALVRTAYTQADAAVEVNEMVLDASSYVLEYRFTS